jgi:hypothetical protein
VTGEVAIVEYLLKLARRDGGRADALAWLVARKRAATTLIFAPAGRDRYGLAVWAVGDAVTPITFAARSDGVRALYMLARDRAVPIDLITEAASGSEAARNILKRAIDELHPYSSALADELSSFTIERGVVRYRPRGDSPRIGIALESVQSRAALAIIGANELEEQDS